MIDHKPKRSLRLQRLENIKANPTVSVLAHEYESSWRRLWWVRVDGPARIVTAGGELEVARRLLTAKYAAYRDNPPEGPAIIIAIEQVTSWQWLR